MKYHSYKSRPCLTVALIMVFSISGCSQVDFQVTSQPSEAEVAINGKPAGTTPLIASLPCDPERKWKSYAVKAFPPTEVSAEPQVKRAWPCSMEKTSVRRLHFEFGDETTPAINDQPENAYQGDMVSDSETIIFTQKEPTKISPIFGFSVAMIEFDDGTFKGSGTNGGILAGASINGVYDVGLEFTTSSQDSIFFWGSDPSFDEGRGLEDYERANLESYLWFLRRNWFLSDRISGFLMLGYSSIELKLEQVSLNCFFIFCLDHDNPVSTDTTYRTRESGPAWGAGLDWEWNGDNYLTVKYVDQSVGDFDYAGWYFNALLRF